VSYMTLSVCEPSLSFSLLFVATLVLPASCLVLPMATPRGLRATCHAPVAAYGWSEMMRNWSSEKPSFSDAEVDEFCRDIESSGCDVDMMEQLMSRPKKAEKRRAPEPIWSWEIDDAVVKTE